MKSLPEEGRYGDPSIASKLVASLAKERALDPRLAEETPYRELIDLLPAAVYVCRKDGTINNYNKRAVELWGRTPGLGETDERFCGSHSLFRPDGTPLPHAETPMATVLATGVPAKDQEVVIGRPDGSRVTVLVNIAPLHSETGELLGAVNCFQDITERKRAEEHRRLLLAELDHRVKNTLAVVQAIASQTLLRSASLDSFATAFTGRLHALAAAHGLLTEHNWQPTQLRHLVELALEPYGRPDGGDRVEVAGENVPVRPSDAMTFSLVLHELATNAAKYGALSAPSGTVSVTWSKERPGAGDRRLRVVWREANGPKVAEPAERGFGFMLIERSVAHELGGEADIRFPAEGLICEITIPLEPESPGP